MIGTDHAGIPEQLGFGGCGTIVPEGDWSAMALAVDSLLSSEARWHGMADAARDRAENCYEASAMGRRLEGIYGDLIRKGPRRRLRSPASGAK